MRLADEFPAYMRHFDGAGEEAIVIGSYYDQFGVESDEPKYTLLLRRGSECSWYQESLMTYVKHGGQELIDQWKKEKEERENKYKDIDWILNNWADMAEKTPGVVIDTLSKFVGAGNMWGSHGEAFTYYQNALMLRELLNEALHTGDKEVFLARCEEVKAKCMR